MSSGGAVSQKEYLKKYLSGGDAEKKKKKKKKEKEKTSSHNKGMRIIEDSLDLKTVPYGYAEEDDAPTIAEVTYDDEKIKILEEFERSKKWKKTLDKSETVPTNRVKDKGSNSPSRRGKNDDAVIQKRARHDSDSETPPRRVKKDSSPPRKKRHDSDSSDSDDSPPRRPKQSGTPPRRTRHDSDSSPAGRHDSESPGRPNESSCVATPPRRQQHESPTQRGRRESCMPLWKQNPGSYTPPLDKKPDFLKKPKNSIPTHTRNQSPSGRKRDSNSSVNGKNTTQPVTQHRQRRQDSSISESPPRRRSRSRHDSDNSPTPAARKPTSSSDTQARKTTKPGLDSQERQYSDSQSDSSASGYTPPLQDVKKPGVPKRKEEEEAERGSGGEQRCEITPHTSPPRRKRHDSDSSPPRKKKPSEDSLSQPVKRQIVDLTTSPPRKGRHDSNSPPPPPQPARKRHDSDSSPPRKKKYDSDASPPRQNRHDSDASPPRGKHSDSDASPPRVKKGKGEGGLIRPERKMTTQEYLSARKHGRLKKDTPEEMARKEREAQLQKQAEEKHQQWKHGVKQVEDYKKKVASDLHEMGKAFTRTADDEDMNAQLKMTARKEDPMLEYIAKKEAKNNKGAVKPVYKGSFPPNRLNIRPGYRWDGVDRSSGFEKRWFEHQNNKRAHNEDAYKWSVSDM